MTLLSWNVKNNPKQPTNQNQPEISQIQRYLICYADMSSPEKFKDRVKTPIKYFLNFKLRAKAKAVCRDTASVPSPELSELLREAESSSVEAQSKAFLLQIWWERTALDSLRDNTDALSLLVLLKREVFAHSLGLDTLEM